MWPEKEPIYFEFAYIPLAFLPTPDNDYLNVFSRLSASPPNLCTFCDDFALSPPGGHQQTQRRGQHRGLGTEVPCGALVRLQHHLSARQLKIMLAFLLMQSLPLHHRGNSSLHHLSTFSRNSLPSK